MVRDKFTHRQHEDDVQMIERRVEDHPVLAWYEERACPRDDCRHHVIEDYEVGHDIELPFDIDERLDALLEEIDLPVIHTYHRAGGMSEGRKAFCTVEEARAYIYGRYGDGNRTPGPGQIRKTYSLSHGSHSQTARKINYPMVFAIVNEQTGDVVGSNLVPRDEDLPDSAPHWRKSVTALLEYHLNPPRHIVQSKLDERRYHIPDDYEDDALTWCVEQVQYWNVVIQTPELLLDDEKLERAIELVDGYTPSPSAGQGAN